MECHDHPQTQGYSFFSDLQSESEQKAQRQSVFLKALASYNNNSIHSTGTSAAVQWELSAIIQRFEYNDWLGPGGDCSSLGAQEQRHCKEAVKLKEGGLLWMVDGWTMMHRSVHTRNVTKVYNFESI